MLVAARTGLISPSIGGGLEFFAIAVVALGAGGLPAGRVRVAQVLVGALILMMIFNYMTIRGVPGTWQTTVTGLLLLAAMVGGRLVQRGSRRRPGAWRGVHATSSSACPARGALLARNAIGAATLLLAVSSSSSIRASLTMAEFRTRWSSRTRRSRSSRSAR